MILPETSLFERCWKTNVLFGMVSFQCQFYAKCRVLLLEFHDGVTTIWFGRWRKVWEEKNYEADPNAQNFMVNKDDNWKAIIDFPSLCASEYWKMELVKEF